MGIGVDDIPPATTTTTLYDDNVHIRAGRLRRLRRLRRCASVSL